MGGDYGTSRPYPPDTLPPAVKYGLLFEHLPSLSLKQKGRDRRPFPRDALLKACIYKALHRLPTLTEVTFELKNNPSVCQAVGLNPYRFPASIERFSQFLRETPLQSVDRGLEGLALTCRLPPPLLLRQ